MRTNWLDTRSGRRTLHCAHTLEFTEAYFRKRNATPSQIDQEYAKAYTVYGPYGREKNMDNTKTKIRRLAESASVPFATIRFTNLSSTAKRGFPSSRAYKLRSPATKRHRINIRILKFCTFLKVRWRRGWLGARTINSS